MSVIKGEKRDMPYRRFSGTANAGAVIYAAKRRGIVSAGPIVDTRHRIITDVPDAKVLRNKTFSEELIVST